MPYVNVDPSDFRPPKEGMVMEEEDPEKEEDLEKDVEEKDHSKRSDSLESSRSSEDVDEPVYLWDSEDGDTDEPDYLLDLEYESWGVLELCLGRS